MKLKLKQTESLVFDEAEVVEEVPHRNATNAV
jgi:hypothetical protein